MSEQRLVLILTYFDSKFARIQIARFAEMLDCAQPFEVSNVFDWKDRWCAYDWESPAFGRAILKRYRKICVYGSASPELREMLERIRPFFEEPTP